MAPFLAAPNSEAATRGRHRWNDVRHAPLIASARAKLKRAMELDHNFESAILLCEDAINEAKSASSTEIEILAHLRASRACGLQLSTGRLEDRTRTLLLESMAKHVNAAEALGASSAAVACERLLIARLSASPEEVLRRADELLGVAEPSDSPSLAGC